MPLTLAWGCTTVSQPQSPEEGTQELHPARSSPAQLLGALWGAGKVPTMHLGCITDNNSNSTHSSQWSEPNSPKVLRCLPQVALLARWQGLSTNPLSPGLRWAPGPSPSSGMQLLQMGVCSAVSRTSLLPTVGPPGGWQLPSTILPSSLTPTL